ncbi:MFS transporter [Brachybacterium nesterenkovii]|uniref:L-Proline/Glycine betaine transporter ProP n=1 Tax=Brachybacterium nesterenkovii TaxID=47847 RepID=A0A1X6X8Z1_9MICO|nr:MFS transporter [Brachybacterium nesterenkovii]SLM95804.1 L-Proline/Glycine betaine transporter ProP [Brachybacterium nesterenkovii]
MARPHAGERTARAERRFRLATRRRRLEADDVLVVERSSIRSAISGTVVGNFMEWFDFGVYGYVTVTLSQLFFQTGDEQLDVLLALLGFAVSVVVRPLGGLVLGPLGDRIGRQKVLFFTMAAMAIATALIGVLPTHAQIGFPAAILPYVLKMVQGFSTGGEYAGAATYVSEFSSDRKRGYYASWLDIGPYLGFATGAGTVALVHAIAPAGWGESAFPDWGWRVPFLVAIPLGAVAIYFRARIPETPAFESAEPGADAAPEEIVADDPLQATGLRSVLRHYRKELLVAIVIVAAANSVGYALTSYMPTFLGTQLGLDKMQSALLTIPAMVLVALSLPAIGRLSDAIGRRRALLLAAIGTLVLSIPSFWLILHATSFALTLLAMLLLGIPTALYLAMLAPTLPAMFPTRARYSAMGFAFNVAVSLFGGTTPLIAQALIGWTGIQLMPAFWIMLLSVLCLLALPALHETAGAPLLGSYPTVEHEDEVAELVEGQDEDPHLDLERMPLDDEIVAVPVDASGQVLEDVGPVVLDDLSPRDRTQLDEYYSTREIPTLATLTGEMPAIDPGEAPDAVAEGSEAPGATRA